MTIVEFLLDRLFEDEETARLAPDCGGWRVDDGQVWMINDVHGDSADALTARFPMWADGAADHIARHDPARVLRECEAKREAIWWYLNDDHVVMEATIAAMAAVYSDHPNYHPEWKP